MTPNRLFKTILCIFIGLAAQSLSAKEQVAEFSGATSGNSPEFEVRAPWIIDWLVSGDPGQYDVVDVALVNAATGSFEGEVLRSRTAGNGVRLFDQSGRFYLRIDASMMHWTFKVIQLTPEEAMRYTPKAG